MDNLGLFTVEQRIKGKQTQAVVLELLSNSIHFPLANIILEMLLVGAANYVLEPDFYIMLLACFLQAAWLGHRQFIGKPMPFIGNLVGPAVYSLIEVSLDGAEFWEAPHHQAYWVFALIVGSLQQIQLYLPKIIRVYVLLAEHLARTSILLVMYAIFEWHEKPFINSIELFLEDESHQFVSIVIGLLGLVVGLGYWSAQRYLETLQETAAQLRIYSEWLLGRDLLDQAVSNNQVLGLSRKQRAVLFMDVRGFTAWSERQSPEQVVSMLNQCFTAAEPICDQFKAIKVKHTGDEIMAVFADPETAVLAAKQMQQAVQNILKPYDLSAGCGVHYGELVEGLIGGEKLRSYDIIGDTVNTAKRLCDNAKGGELLVSEPVFLAYGEDELTLQRQIKMKGKQQLFSAYLI
ncbi:Adenylate cyclase, class 3 [Oceanospirillum multiglobuliferum]|uniref:adenylate/guanylate cyclase domain-containing protein n=1 Tax=Oceanospirillum multiglobuliferum TaxID=64969 RepID=UPI00099B2399|nr:adenylate/guanylate cyclase domain-containing protein [Oceanospirillum multiglobuliferum]SKA26205.1 Adenylate cyclase, class 3 [Oceanospirillum multiglobuliferum]